jgi:DNA polymerase I
VEKKLFLLDAMALIYRAYYAVSGNLRNSKGQNTAPIFGFANTLLEVITKEKPTHLAVAFDTIALTQRHTDFADYKANRQDTPEDILAALPYIKRLLQGFNIPILLLDGYEADDIIGTVAKKSEQQGFKVYMMTPDKDFGQLVSENIFMYKPARMGNKVEVWGVKEVCERFSIERPEQVADILGLWGDSSDNIPGVPGIGEKKAKKLIGEFGSIENILANVDKVQENRCRESLKQNADKAILSKKLATIILDVPIPWEEEDFRITPPDPEKLMPLFEELEFRSLPKRIFGEGVVSEPAATYKISTPPSIATGQLDLFSDVVAMVDPVEEAHKKLINLLKEKDYHSVTSPQQVNELIEKLKSSGSFCFDTETNSLDNYDCQLVGISFCIEPGQAWFVPFPEDQQKARQLADNLRDIFEDPSIEKIGQNLKFDIGVLKNYNIGVEGKLFDTMLAHYLLQPDMRHNMDLLSETYLGYCPVSIELLIGKKGKSQKTLREIDPDLLLAYACEDADVTLQLRNVFRPLLEEQGLMKLFDEVEAPLVNVLAEMERQGVKIDEKALEDYSVVLQKEIEKIEKEIYLLAGSVFNIGSPKQLGVILFSQLKIMEKAKMTRTKQFSTSEDVLSKLVDKHPIVGKILDYRSLTKLKSTYVDSLPKLIHPGSGRIHTTYNQAVAATGRLSSNNPNLQNIPIRTEEGRFIRKAFVARDYDYLLLAADYSQIELRIIAALSKDDNMLEAFNKGYDIHSATASRIYDIDIDQVSREMRRNAKTVNFGLVYGISAFGLSERLNIPRHEAAQIIEQYFFKYPGIRRYMDETIDFAKKNGYVSTILGRRRYVPDINSSNNTVRGFAERNAINAPIQGSAADMIKLAMINIFREMKENALKSRMIMQVHDELVFDAHKEELEVLMPMVERNMKHAVELPVPIVIEMNTAGNWLDAH